MAHCRDCGEEFTLARLALGYRSCLECGDNQAKQVKWTVAIPYSKGAYQVMSPEDLKGTDPKRRS